jgi:large subunit ribosomal protein L15
MTTNKRPKNRRQRGYTTHGWGSMKKHRGAGHRGGRGRAGSGKRGDAKKPVDWKSGRKQGRVGFKTKSRAIKEKPINIKTIEDRIERLVTRGLAKVQNGSYYLNLEDMGFNKLLSTGRATRKYMITTPLAVANAVEKVKAAGGNVTVTLVKKEKKPKQAVKKPAKKDDEAESDEKTD